jgi:Holliday junction resolvasome RuvABC endonuclease subunit
MSAPRKELVAFDLASNTGWAATRNGTIQTGMIRVNGTHGQKFHDFAIWANVLIQEHKPQAVYFEDASASARRTSITQAAHWFGFRAELLRLAYMNDLPAIPIGTGQYKTAIGLKGNAPKDEVRASVHAAGFPVEYEDEADAVAILAAALHEHGAKLSDFRYVKNTA